MKIWKMQLMDALQILFKIADESFDGDALKFE